MYDSQYKILMASTARPISIEAARRDIVKLEGLKAKIGYLPQTLKEIDQVNSIRKRVGVVQQKIRKMEEEREFRKRDQLREKKDDGFQVKPVQDEVIARGSYRK